LQLKIKKRVKKRKKKQQQPAIVQFSELWGHLRTVSATGRVKSYENFEQVR
jgi:hypothetical protein